MSLLTVPNFARIGMIFTNDYCNSFNVYSANTNTSIDKSNNSKKSNIENNQPIIHKKKFFWNCFK